jgi:hypothetical protein
VFHEEYVTVCPDAWPLIRCRFSDYVELTRHRIAIRPGRVE